MDCCDKCGGIIGTECVGHVGTDTNQFIETLTRNRDEWKRRALVAEEWARKVLAVKQQFACASCGATININIAAGDP